MSRMEHFVAGSGTITVDHAYLGKGFHAVRAFAGGERVGSASISFNRRGVLSLDNIQVHPEHRRAGVGTALLDAIEKKHGVPSSITSPSREGTALLRSRGWMT